MDVIDFIIHKENLSKHKAIKKAEEILNSGSGNLDLPDAFGITQNDPLGGTAINFSLNYLYRADGVKVRKTYSSGGGRGQSTSYKYTDYLDGFQYSFSETVQPCLWCRTSVAYEQEAFRDPVPFDPGPVALGWQLDFVPTAEGFYSFTENRYIYQYRDHLDRRVKENLLRRLRTKFNEGKLCKGRPG